MSNNIVFNKEYIESFAQEIDRSFCEQVLSHTVDILAAAVNDIKNTKPVILDCQYDLANEYLTGAQTQNSSLDVFLEIKSPQVELNSITHSKNRFRAFWNRFLINWRAVRSKKVKKRRFWQRKKKENKEETTVNIPSNKYNILDLKKELFSNIANYLSSETFISTTNFGFKINGKDEFGIEVNIIPVLKNGSKQRIYNSYKSQFVDFDNLKRVENLKIKIEATNGQFVTMLRVFNNLYFHIMGNNPNQVFMESLLNSCPDELFINNESVFDNFLKIANYLNMTNLSSIKSIMDNSKGLFQERLNPIGVYECKKFLSQIVTVI